MPSPNDARGRVWSFEWWRWMWSGCLPDVQSRRFVFSAYGRHGEDRAKSEGNIGTWKQPVKRWCISKPPRRWWKGPEIDNLFEAGWPRWCQFPEGLGTIEMRNSIMLVMEAMLVVWLLVADRSLFGRHLYVNAPQWPEGWAPVHDRRQFCCWIIYSLKDYIFCPLYHFKRSILANMQEQRSWYACFVQRHESCIWPAQFWHQETVCTVNIWTIYHHTIQPLRL